VTGLLGKRTKFQDRDISQLAIQAQSAMSMDDEKSVTEGLAPKNLQLNDDTLHETIQFAKANDQNETLELETGNLKVQDQCILLALW
jgi:hypothetical protein